MAQTLTCGPNFPVLSNVWYVFWGQGGASAPPKRGQCGWVAVRPLGGQNIGLEGGLSLLHLAETTRFVRNNRTPCPFLDNIGGNIAWKLAQQAKSSVERDPLMIDKLIVDIA